MGTWFCTMDDGPVDTADVSEAAAAASPKSFDSLGLDLLGNPQEGEETPAEETPLRLVPPKPTITKKRASSAGPNAFCLNVTEPRYYRAPTGCKCDCPGCNCRRYYACWDCDVLADGCLSQAAYLCDIHQSIHRCVTYYWDIGPKVIA